MNSKALKKAAKEAGADLVGIASMDRFEGARGCMRECLAHLEKQGKLTRKFRNPFRTKKPWRLTDEAVSADRCKPMMDNEEYSHY